MRVLSIRHDADLCRALQVRTFLLASRRVDKRVSIQTGCCGFALAQAKYFATFPCVEVDTSFYNLPQLTTAAKWRAAAPAGFQFAMRAWQVITHAPDSPTYKRTRLDARDRPYCGGFGFNPTVRWAWDQTFQVAKELGVFLVLFQCPVSFRPTRENIERLRQFFVRAKRGKFALGWEPRGNWEPAMVAQLCTELDLVHVVDPLQSRPATRARFQYYRLHRGERFTTEELHRLRALCRAEKLPTYCFFNNRAMAADAARFRQLTFTPPVD
jgi:uncharacterized protein YecE (DUF72 family)